ncbi:MAG: DUF1295 domain-containing protein [Planctomycetota bacterium]|nr:DUF1295 domain-containing protein [Planctomycetota bacterium]
MILRTLAILLAGWTAMALVMALLWVLQKRTGRAGVVDVAWAGGIAALSILFAAVASGDPARRILVAALAAAWGLRLAWHLHTRLGRTGEDGRYAQMKRRWGDKADRYMLGFYQIQASWSVIFAMPMLVAAGNPAAFPQAYDIAGAAVWVIAVAGETIADRQLGAFRESPANKGRVCRDGLWGWSRHPNYFFEWVHWWAYVAIGLAAPWGWLTLLGPAVMLCFLLKVTGVPPTEAQALLSRGEAYREYQRTTSVFFLWPPRKESRA